MNHYKVLIVGGGTAGITVASQLARLMSAREIAIIEPNSYHYYQPIWTLVGAGLAPFSKQETMIMPLKKQSVYKLYCLLLIG